MGHILHLRNRSINKQIKKLREKFIVSFLRIKRLIIQKKPESPSHKETKRQVNIGLVVRQKVFFIFVNEFQLIIIPPQKKEWPFILKFRYCIFSLSLLSPLGKPGALPLNKVEFPSYKNALRQICLKLNKWFLRRKF